MFTLTILPVPAHSLNEALTPVRIDRRLCSRMTETQRETVPRNDGGELDTATAFLGFARHCLIKKTEGLTDEQLRRVLVDSGASLLGLIQHSAVGERWWFGYYLLGTVQTMVATSP